MSSPRVKICGITRGEDARLAVSLGATYLGFILYPKSPRGISLDDFEALKQTLPDSFRVAVDVRPSIEEIKKQMSAGFDFFQVHFSEIHDSAYLLELSETVGRDRLWLAPKLPPDMLFPESLFQYADTFLIDTYHAGGFGGSGETGDWAAFKQLNIDYPEKCWILAGGLNPENMGAALILADPKIVDASSGVELSPGIKSSEKLRAFFSHLPA
ncbi:MAG: phosphoribosylanthranilate isomerase [Verrucomicrobia bacterium]|nr:phosphoribosylanthranilate isomerase [Verrucomicrobiota bacterium]MDA1067579.1 phosphoribosylanthranilate isomerase [Verrucomicrobiota bacterium]